MHCKAKKDLFCITPDMKVVVQFTLDINPEEAREKLSKMDGDLVLDVTKFRERKSLDANNYFWELCTKLAKALNTDKWTMYLLELSKYGVSTPITIRKDAYQKLKEYFRFIQILDEYERDGVEFYNVDCYYGISTYNTKEMSELIEGTIFDAKEQGIDTITPDEYKAMISAWKGGKDVL